MGRDEPNVDLEFRNRRTGCGASVLVYMRLADIEKLKQALTMPGLDMDIIAFAYPYKGKGNHGER